MTLLESLPLMGTAGCRFAKFRDLPMPLSAAEWENFTVETVRGYTGITVIDGGRTETSVMVGGTANHPPTISLIPREIPIVGSKHMGVEPFPITGPLRIQGEPGNAFDSTALVVLHEEQPIGYVPKVAKHWLGCIHPSVIGSCREVALANDGGWYMALWVPSMFVAGYYAFNSGSSQNVQGETPRDRNWWGFGWNSAKLRDVG